MQQNKGLFPNTAPCNRSYKSICWIILDFVGDFLIEDVSMEDLQGAGFSFVLLQDVYHMNLSQVAKGYINIKGQKEIYTGNPLTGRSHFKRKYE